MHTKVIQNDIKNYIRNSRILTITGLTSTLLLSLLILTIYQPLYYHGKNEQKVIATTGSSIQATTSLSITTASDVAGVDLLVKDNNGTFASSDDSGNTLGFNVTTNNYTGYTLTISGKDDDGLLTNNDNNCTSNCTLSSISSSLSADSFNTTTYNGKWGYRPNKLNSSDNTNYLPSPTTTASTLDITNTPNTTAKEYTIGIAARATYTQQAGVYSNTYILQAVANKVAYSVSYADNTGDNTVKNLPATTAGSTDTTSITLSSTVPTRTGYTFNKWCLGTVSNSGTTCTGTEYSAGGSFGIDQTTTNTITLYATWTANKYNLVITGDNNVSSISVKAGSTTGASTTCAKSGTAFTCPSLTYGISYYLYPVFASGYEFSSWAKTDTATNAQLGSTTAVNTYYTMGDGAGALTLASKSSKTYMQDFTKSGCQSLASSANYTVYDRRDDNDYTVRYINNACWMTRNLRFTGTSLSSTTSNVNTDRVITYGDLASGNSYTDARIRNSTNTTYGVWYNFCAAAAKGSTGACAQSTYTGTESVCPAGWTLPTNSQFSGITRSGAFGPVAGGYYGDGTLLAGNSVGSWWSSTASGTDSQYYLSYTNSTLSTTSYLNKTLGRYVRCVRTS